MKTLIRKISCSIDLKKINKDKIKPHKNGASYYSLDILQFDQIDDYGNTCAVTEGQTKEEREAKLKSNFIGNGRIVFEKDTPRTEEPKSTETIPTSDLPF